MRKLVLILALMLLPGFTAWADKCQHGEHDGQHDHAACSATCAKAGKEVVNTTNDVVLVGTMQCAKCDLKSSDKCQKVLTTADQKSYVLCPNSLEGKDVKNLSRKQVQVKGTMFDLRGEDSVVHVNEIAAAPAV
jgi:hypothetical protein